MNIYYVVCTHVSGLLTAAQYICALLTHCNTVELLYATSQQQQHFDTKWSLFWHRKHSQRSDLREK